MANRCFCRRTGGKNFYIGHCHVKLMAMDGGREGMFFCGRPEDLSA